MQFDTEEFTERINEIPRRMMSMQTQESNWVFVVSLGTFLGAVLPVIMSMKNGDYEEMSVNNNLL